MLNSFEDAIVTVLLEVTYFEFVGDKNDITPESCRKSIESYSSPFLWDNQEAIRASLKHTDIPCELVSVACQFAWNQLNWDAIAESVKDEV